MIPLEPGEHGGGGTGHRPESEPAYPLSAVDVPERPALAPSVRLVGEMPGTSFVDRQWLAERHGHFVQLTELLYRTAEHVNGNRTLAQIAGRVTDSTDWEVTPDDVRQILRTKLIPAGLVTGAEGPAVSRARPLPGDRTSPLGIKLRFRLFGPRTIDPITSVLQFLFAPPLAIPVLIALAIAHWWLYVEHDVARAFGAGLYPPGALLVVVAITLASMVFHEFGHASALRYGGGHARQIGGGIYLVFPALYTDVTDGYRLGRWARVRTALGGVYFHLIVAVGLIALYQVSRLELFLFVAVLIDLDVLRQFLPFVRLDGYWLLADLTGIPDFFSQMRPFLRSLASRPGSTGTRLPRLKPWAAKVFLGYIILTIPMLSILFLLTLTGLPRFVAVTGDSLVFQSVVFASARTSGELLRMSASVTTMVLLALPVLATCYFLWSAARKLASGVWEWATTPARRLVAGLGTSGAVTVLGVLWIPALPPAGVETFDIRDHSHISAPVFYPQTPPVGGPHAPNWQNCGFYDAPVLAEYAVASLAHGAIWITYRPDLPQEQRDLLRGLAQRESLVLVSPYPALPAPVVASAWGRQLRLHSADDRHLGQFVRVFQNGLQAPERGEPCTGGAGVPR